MISVVLLSHTCNQSYILTILSDNTLLYKMNGVRIIYTREYVVQCVCIFTSLYACTNKHATIASLHRFQQKRLTLINLC